MVTLWKGVLRVLGGIKAGTRRDRDQSIHDKVRSMEQKVVARRLQDGRLADQILRDRGRKYLALADILSLTGFCV